MMDLKKAIQRVAKVVPRKKEKAALQMIRFLPAHDGGPPYVFATDGLRSCLVNVDLDDLPNALLPAGDLVKVSKDPDILEVVDAGLGKIKIRTTISTYQLQGVPFDHFPGVPMSPAEYEPAKDWAQVAKCFHAAGNETVDPELAVIRFTPGYVEATDKARLVRVEVSGPWDGLVPVSTFKTWPKGEVFTAFTATHAFFWVEDELRIGALLNLPNYPKTSSVMPTGQDGPHIIVPTRPLQAAVKQGADLSDLGMVTLEITDRLVVRAWSEKQDRSTYEASVEIYSGTGNEGMLLVTGKYLVEALKQVDTLNFKLGFGGVSDPLRIESGCYVACIWQLVYA
jgi:DNA polymerase III sliding clamp (beta) subunit (PCNA family)